MAEAFLLHRDIGPGETLLPYDIQQLCHVQSDAENGGGAHDVEEDLLLGSADVTFHRVRTGTGLQRNIKGTSKPLYRK